VRRLSPAYSLSQHIMMGPCRLTYGSYLECPVLFISAARDRLIPLRPDTTSDSISEGRRSSAADLLSASRRTHSEPPAIPLLSFGGRAARRTHDTTRGAEHGRAAGATARMVVIHARVLPDRRGSALKGSCALPFSRYSRGPPARDGARPRGPARPAP
jgi:hypothetical protein